MKLPANFFFSHAVRFITFHFIWFKLRDSIGSKFVVHFVYVVLLTWLIKSLLPIHFGPYQSLQSLRLVPTWRFSSTLSIWLLLAFYLCYLITQCYLENNNNNKNFDFVLAWRFFPTFILGDTLPVLSPIIEEVGDQQLRDLLLFLLGDFFYFCQQTL